MNTISENPPQLNPKIEIKSSFMPKIKREPKEKLFNKKICSNLTKYLFDFFDYKDLYEKGKINLFFMNNIIDYFIEKEPWPEKVRKLKSKYNFIIYKDEVDNTLKEAQINKRRYKFSSIDDKKVNYYQFDIDGNQYISIARTFEWAHKNNFDYWSEVDIQGSYENNKVPYLKDVCWLDTNFSFFNVKPNNYKLYINEHFKTNKGFKERVILKVIIDENIVIYEKKFPDQNIFDNNSSERENSRLNEDFICYIKKTDFDKAKKDKNDNCIVNVIFWHGDDQFWKSGWFIDGGSLKEVTQKEIDEETEKKK